MSVSGWVVARGPIDSCKDICIVFLSPKLLFDIMLFISFVINHFHIFISFLLTHPSPVSTLFLHNLTDPPFLPFLSTKYITSFYNLTPSVEVSLQIYRVTDYYRHTYL
ncbi:hypothetical protein VNO77_30276 [Canavalia gladiata]|uniref:Uncharacterized protein n=1 Tax=Canavalia gladiata TaxID=3824 RepID=A0AAN9Q734_CANGL